ncbi:MAG: hypothetical protein H6705_14150 [Myxococcales bacterium]|nr:hypothetical protein [Myxococcales bacterium]
MVERSASVGRHVRSFIRGRGELLLERLGETPYAGADWSLASHGAVIRVRGEHDTLFERLVVVLPRPSDAPADRFRAWADTRLAHLGWYMETCNTGRLVHRAQHDVSVVGVFMQRVGRDPNDRTTELPAPAEVPELLRVFALNLERYVVNLGDDELRYVRALRLYRVPRHERPDDFVLGVDVLPTVIGLAEPTVPIDPLTLVRGVIGEMAELFDQRREEQARALTPLRPGEWRVGRRVVVAMERLVAALDALCGWIDAERPTLAMVRARLEALAAPRRPRRGWALALVVVGAIGAGVWAVLAR